ncbi:MAG: hypothetical protein IKV61_02830 [Clostridia bacterium]|nr:hypothetical protein [Clostridia bacterium]
MKKLTAIFALFLASMLLLTGCVSTTILYDGEYWNSTPATFQSIEETIVYDVTTTTKTLSSDTEVKNQYLRLIIDEGTYTVTLKGVLAKVNYYELTTELKIKGKYEYGPENSDNTVSIPVDDYLKTYTKFESLANGFKPIYSSRTTYNDETQTKHYNTSMYSYMSGFVESHLSYDYSIEYDGKNATSNILKTYLTADEETGEMGEEKIEDTFNYNNYDGGAYIDNNLITLLPRAFNLEDSFYQEFTTIDVPTHSVKKMLYSVSENSSTVSQFTFDNLTYDYKINDTPQVVESGFTGYLLYAAIDDTFSGTPIELYYATDASFHRHRLIKSYTALNDSMGYLEYTIKSVSLK